MVSGWSFQPGTIGRQYTMTLVRALAAHAVAIEVVVIALLAIGSTRGSAMPE
jgi:hypothetical protein